MSTRNKFQDWLCMILSWLYRVVLVGLRSLHQAWQKLEPRPDVHRLDRFRQFELGTRYKDGTGQVFWYRRIIKKQR